MEERLSAARLGYYKWREFSPIDQDSNYEELNNDIACFLKRYTRTRLLLERVNRGLLVGLIAVYAFLSKPYLLEAPLASSHQVGADTFSSSKTSGYFSAIAPFQFFSRRSENDEEDQG
jgi:hypothetical protein